MINDENLFSDFSYESWAPEDLQRLYPTLDSALSQLETAPNIGAAFAVFWKLQQLVDPDYKYVFSPELLEELSSEDVGDEQRMRLLAPHLAGFHLAIKDQQTRLAKLVALLEPIVGPDEPISEKSSCIFAHVASAYASLLERKDSARTERYWELCEKALAFLLRRPRIDRFETDDDGAPEDGMPLVTSNELIKTMLWAQQFRRLCAIGSYESALSALHSACDLCIESDNHLFQYTGVITVEDWIAMGSGRMVVSGGSGNIIERGPGILSGGSGQQWLAYLIPAQEAADAFEHLVSRPSDGVNWQGIASWCLDIQLVWDEPTPEVSVRTNLLPISESARDFWIMARGLALQKISPNELAKFWTQTQNTQSEARLRRYFFGDLWDEMPTEAQQALIAADLVYSATEGIRVDVFENLRRAVEPVLEATVVVPFKQWLTGQSIDYVSASRHLLLPLSRSIAEIWDQNRRWFDEYTKSQYPEVGEAFWSQLGTSLIALREIRQGGVHPEDRGDPKGQAIRNLYHLFMGINNPGIIKSLLDLKTGKKPALQDSDLL